MSNTTTIGDVCEVIAGQSPPSNTYNKNGDGLPFFQGKADFGYLYPEQIRIWCSAPQKIAEEGDILISVRAPVGPTNICNQRACIGRGLSAIRSGSTIDPKYLLYFLRKNEPKLASQGKGSTFSSITQKDIKKIPILVPPLEDQKRIVSTLDQADALRRKRKESIKLLDEYVRSVFIEMFGDPVTNPKGWGVVRFDRLGKFVSGGTPSKQNKAYWMGDFPWVSPKDMKHFYIDGAIDHVSEIVFQDTSLKKIVPNTLLIVVRGMILAHSFPVAINRVPVSINQDMKAVELDESIRPLYAKIALDCMKSKILSHVSTAAHGTKRFDAEGMKKILVPVPPISLQDAFCTKLEIVEKMKNSMKMQSSETSQLFDALNQKAFTGTL